MLSILRKKAQSPVIQGTVLIIALVFIFWGVGTSRQGGRNAVATVNDEAVTFQDYQRAYDQYVTNLRSQFGGNIPKGLLDSLDIQGQVLNQLTQKILLRQGAEEMGIVISKEETKKAIEEMEAFRNNDRFDLQQYEAILSASRMTPAIFESSMQSDLLTSKVLDNLGRFTKVTEDEIIGRFLFDNEQVALEFVAFTPEKYKEKIQPDEESLTAFYEENKENYKADSQIQLSYLFFSKEDSTREAEFTDEQIQSYYDRNIDIYSKPEQRWARHILLKTSAEDTDEVREQKLTQAQDVLQMAQAGDDFAELAKEYSEGPSAPKGGDLGLFTKGRMVKPFEDAVFAMQPGEISDIVETSFGYHIIKLEDIIPGSLKPLEEVKDEIRTTLTTETTKNRTFTKANEAYESIIAAGSMEKFAESSQTPVLQTGFFTRKSPPSEGDSPELKILTNPVFLNAAFSLQKGELSSLIDIDSSYAIIYVKDQKDQEILPLPEVREEVVKDYVAKQAQQMARESAESLLASLIESENDVEADWAEAVKKLDLVIEQTGLINRQGRGEKNNEKLPITAIEESFRLSEEQPYPEKIVEMGNTFVVYKFIEKNSPLDDLQEEKQEELRTQLLTEKKGELLAAWLENQKSKAEISINEELL
jgi:peptidyl-prolyl cis-trans isomerase D